MLPTKAVRLQLGSLLAADTTTLAPVAANKIHLVINAFTPDESLPLASFTLATFTGSTALAGTAGAQPVGTDPVTGAQLITIAPPAGGYIWTCTVAPSPPQTVYGFILTDSAGAVLLGMALLPNPQTIQAVGDQIDIGNPTLTIVQRPIS